MAMPLVYSRIGRQAIEIPVPVNIPNPYSTAAREHDIQRPVIVRPIGLLEMDIVPAVHDPS
jgi:hypothetical protein